jgi:hypothetical protein
LKRLAQTVVPLAVGKQAQLMVPLQKKSVAPAQWSAPSAQVPCPGLPHWPGTPPPPQVVLAGHGLPQAPAQQVPASQAVPSALVGLEQVPVAGSQTPAT